MSAGITVTGTGTASGTPDRLHLGLAVEVRGPTAIEAFSKAADAVAQVFEALDNPGMPPLVRTTQQVGLQAELAWGEHQEQRVTGYVATQVLAVTVDDLASASVVLETVVQAGGDNLRITSVSFGLSDPAARVALAQEAAWADAMDRAQRLAAMAGRKLGAVEDISEGSTPSPLPAARRVAMAQEMSMPIEPGEAEVTSTVTVRWALEPA